MRDTRRVSAPVEGSVARVWRSRLGGRVAAADLAPVAAVSCLALPQLVHHLRFSDPRLGLYLVMSVLLIAALTVRRRFPLSVLALLAALMLAQSWAGIQLIAGASLLIGLYSVASRYPLRVAGPSGVVAVSATVPVVLQASHGFGWAEVIVIVSAFMLAALMCGAYVRNRASTIQALTEAAAQLGRERDQHAQLAAARERAELAREMHDIIAHSLSVMVTLADAAALKVPGHPHEAAATMGRVSEVGRQAIGDSRRVLGILRTDASEPLTPQPGLADLEVLVERVQHDGLEAGLTMIGPVAAVPPAAGLTLYRIAQEAITNALRHARGATGIRVTVTIAATTVTVHIHDDGEPAGAAAGTPPDGHGIPGMRERAKAYGGTVTVGPAPDGGWDVQARLPLTGGGHLGADRP